MQNFTDSQINTMMSALADSARAQSDAAAEIEAKTASESLPEGRSILAELGKDLREGAEEANLLRLDFASEYHRRGRSHCDLAHAGLPCPN
jgi:hypothetical protein